MLTVFYAEKTVGAVTALALSHDHTFVGAGHATGHIQLFDLSKPHVPARSVPPTTLAAVASGRKEGHLQGARIVNIGFVAGRHTAVVSADHTGLAFYHSLGKALFFEATDVLRILGKYPNEEPVAVPVPEHPPIHRRRGRRINTILAMAPLPLGTVPHPTDAYNVTALLTAAKLVIVGLKPSPKTWYRKHRDEDDEPPTGGKTKFRAALAWFPSVVVVPSDASVSADAKPATGKKEKGGSAKNAKGDTRQQPTTPMLAYSWGSTLHLLLVSELKTRENVTNQRTGKPTTVEIGRLVFEEKVRWRARDVVHAVQWLNAKVGSFFASYTTSARRRVSFFFFFLSFFSSLLSVCYFYLFIANSRRHCVRVRSVRRADASACRARTFRSVLAHLADDRTYNQRRVLVSGRNG